LVGGDLHALLDEIVTKNDNDPQEVYKVFEILLRIILLVKDVPQDKDIYVFKPDDPKHQKEFFFLKPEGCMVTILRKVGFDFF
jgi:hypothetical protein